MAFCNNCGSYIEDETKSCPVCNSIPDDNNKKNNLNASNAFNSVKTKVAGNKKLALVIGVIAVVLVIVLVISLFGGKGYEKAVDKYIDVMLKGNVEKVKDLAPEAYWDYLEDTYDVDIDDLVEELEETSEDMLEAFEDEYGERIKISYKVTDADRFDEDDLKDVKDALKDKYDIAKKSVTDAYELEIELKIKGSDDEDEDEMELYAVKVDGKWYVMSEYYSFLVPGM